MADYETFYREDPLEVRPAHLSANIYNLAHRLLVRGGADCLFVPIRAIQYMAVLDAEEIIFVDREAKHLVEIAWRKFRPQARAALSDPVPYEIHLYLDKANETLARLQGEFFKALMQMDERTASGRLAVDDAPIVPFPGKRNK